MTRDVFALCLIPVIAGALILYTLTSYLINGAI